jgi:hypothetical protein
MSGASREPLSAAANSPATWQQEADLIGEHLAIFGRGGCPGSCGRSTTRWRSG